MPYHEADVKSITEGNCSRCNNEEEALSFADLTAFKLPRIDLHPGVYCHHKVTESPLALLQ